MELLYEDLTGRIIQSCFEVMNELGVGFLESVYEKALLIVLQNKGIRAANQVPLTVTFRGQEVGQFFADIFVERKIILELKAVDQVASEHKAQLINYLKVTNIEVGLLINFGVNPIKFYRLSKPKSTEASK